MNIDFVKPSATLVDRSSGKKVCELAGRACWGSEDRMTSHTNSPFLLDKLKRGHMSLFEHGVMYNVVSNDVLFQLYLMMLESKFQGIRFIQMARIPDTDTCAIAVNYRTAFELHSLLEKWESGYGISPDVKDIFSGTAFDQSFQAGDKSLDEVSLANTFFNGKLPKELKYLTFNIICDRAIGNEITRHRLLSFSQVSTRYVSYEKNIKFCVPYHLQGVIEYNVTEKGVGAINKTIIDGYLGLDKYSSEQSEVATFTKYCAASAINYRDYPAKPNIARGVLPLFLATEMYATGPAPAWENFLHYRLEPGAHQDVRLQIAASIKEVLGEYYPDDIFEQYNKYTGECDDDEHSLLSSILDNLN